MYTRYVSSGILFRRHNFNVASENIRSAYFLSQNCCNVQGRFIWCSRKISIWLRQQSVQVVEACTRQFEFIAAQRIRRSIQLFHLYTRIWDEIALKEFIKSWRCRVTRNTKDFFIGATGLTMYDWQRDKIEDKEMYSYSQEIEGIHKLQNLTVICSDCNLRLVIDVKQPGVKYCQCHKTKSKIKKDQDEIEWQPFIERQDMLVWKREEKEFGGLYSYKVYGSFDDVSAEDFLQVQIDIDYRKKWDATAKELQVIDTDPSSRDSVESCSDIIYWEMIWPRMFANRDYVYQRRWLYDKETGMVIIVSRGTDHPNAPVRPDAYRVTTYWSYMVIKPYTNFDEPGIEFGLTYFDDPGVNIPSAVTAWVAMSGLPDYLCRMRQAGKDYKHYKALQESEGITEKSIIMTNRDDEDSTSNISKQQDETRTEDSQIHPDNINNELTNNLEKRKILKTTPTKTKSTKDDSDKEEEIKESDPTKDEDQGFMDYFFLSKLFA